jgi:branched-chain amino acid aminotransferase
VDTYYVDGEFVEEDDARLSVKDITVLRGYGVFDFLITYNRRPFHLEDHVARLVNSAAGIGLQIRHENSQICDIVVETVQRNSHHAESNIRMVYTGGISPDGVTPQGNGILMVLVTPKAELPGGWYADGAAVVTVDMERFMPISKSTNYLTAVCAQQIAREQGAIEAIYVDRKNRVLEGTTTNIFGLNGNTLVTPPDGILPGITRSVVLKLAEGKYEVQLRHIEKDELAAFDEIFICASNKEIVPVIKIDERAVGDGRPGRQTAAIMKLFREYTAAYGRG